MANQKPHTHHRQRHRRMLARIRARGFDLKKIKELVKEKL